MKKYLVFAMFVVLVVALTSPVSVSAKTKAGAKPGSLFYFFDKAFEKTSLFFTFNPEKKAKKVLENAEERLAEAEELKKEKEEKEAPENKKEQTKEAETSEKEVEKTDNKLEEDLKEEKNEKFEIKNNQKEEQSKEIEKLEQNKEFQPKKIDQSSEIEKLQKEIQNLKQKVEKQLNTSSSLASLDLSPVNITPSNITVCNGKNWTACPSGQKFYCPSTGDAQCLIENIPDQNNYGNSTQNQQTDVALPTPQQLTNLRHFCLSDSFLNSVCIGSDFMPGYFSNLNFREGIDALIVEYNAIISEQRKKQIANEKSTINCLMTIMPEELRVLDPSTQYYLRQLKCGTATESDKANYESQQIKSSIDDLKTKLDSNTSFQPLFLDLVQLPTSNTSKWQVRWDGSGGTITTSDGGIYQFHCEDNSCRSY